MTFIFNGWNYNTIETIGLKKISVCWILIYNVFGDIFLHSPRGSNNRLNEEANNRRTGNRLFDSQNNNRGGHNVGDSGSQPAKAPIFQNYSGPKFRITPLQSLYYGPYLIGPSTCGLQNVSSQKTQKSRLGYEWAA